MELHERTWVAGIVDSDGCITYSKRQPRIIIVNTHYEFLNRIQEVTEEHEGRIYNGSNVNSAYKDGVKRRPYYQLVFYTKKNCKGLLEEILPYLIIKKEKAQVMINGIN